MVAQVVATLLANGRTGVGVERRVNRDLLAVLYAAFGVATPQVSHLLVANFLPRGFRRHISLL